MNLLPEKHSPQEWVDVPLFGAEDEVASPPPRTKKQDADDAGVKWRRRPRTARQLPCQDCLAEPPAQRQAGVGLASYIRIEGGAEVYVCLLHKAERGFREDLERG